GGREITADISGGDYCAPIGYLDGGEVSGLGVSGKINGRQSAGGVVGYNYGGIVTSCYFRGEIIADNYAGGVAGINMGIIESCYALANITTTDGDTFAGGVAGINDFDGVVKYSYYVGAVQSPLGGGIVGYAGRGNLTGCYYDKENIKKAYAAAGESIITDTEGRSKDEMSGENMNIGDKYSYKTTGSDWGCYPALKVFDNGRFDDYNEYAGWRSHLINTHLLIAVQEDGIDITALKEGKALQDGFRRGYDFTGWYTSAEGGEKVEYVEGGSDMVIFGRYDIITYKITYSLAGGMWSEGYKAVSEYTVLDEVQLPTADNVYMSESNFSGWSTAGGEVVSVIERGSIGDITLTAQFKLKPVAVISRAVTDYIWVILDVAAALIIIIEISVLLRVRKKREGKAYGVNAFLPVLTSAMFYPA
ncbi:MAG: InlB B-repeat-containing protein, partial [Clostridia bacterium]|nr:InlB B-repeat-containing protein [Clostridia bacterium]